VAGGWRILKDMNFHNSIVSRNNTTKEGEMGEECSTQGETKTISREEITQRPRRR
jgi:hypothetical protein